MPCSVHSRTANESLPQAVLAAEMEAMQLQLRGAALSRLPSPLHCARWMLQPSWHELGVLKCALCRKDGNEC